MHKGFSESDKSIDVIVDTKPWYSKYIGIAIMIVAMAFFSMMLLFTSFTYQLYPNTNGLDLNLIRAAFMILLSIPPPLIFKVNVFRVPKEARILLFIKWVCSGSGAFMYGIAFKYVDVFIGAQLNYLQPIFVVIFSHMLECRALPPIKLFVCMLAFIATCMIGYERADFSTAFMHSLSNLGYFLCFSTGLISSFHHIAGRELNRYVHFIYAPVYMMYYMALVPIIILGVAPQIFNFEEYTWGFVGMVGLVSWWHITAHILISVAACYENPSTLALFCFIDVMIVFAGDVIWFKAILTPLELWGWALITLTIFIALIAHKKAEPVERVKQGHVEEPTKHTTLKDEV